MNPHYKGDGTDESAVPEFIIDYYLMGQDDCKSAPMLACKDKSETPWSSTVLAKGAGAYAVNLLAGWIRESGYKRLHLKSDNEPAVLALKDKVIKALSDIEVMPTESVTDDDQSNGEIECMVREQKRQIRALKSDIEHALQIKLMTPTLCCIGRQDMRHFSLQGSEWARTSVRQARLGDVL